MRNQEGKTNGILTIIMFIAGVALILLLATVF